MLRAVDLFCCAGGASMGLHRAGFRVLGIDHRPQPRYPFEFFKADALGPDAWELIRQFKPDFIWASPPCQKYTRMNQGLTRAQGRAKEHPDLIAPTRALLKELEVPYIIENVEGAPLINPIRLCGSAFGLDVQRHRLFESNCMLLELPCCHGRYLADKPPLHRLQGRSRVVGCYGNGRGKGDTVAAWAHAMGIDWMTRPELAQAIPPAYSQFLGAQVARIIQNTRPEDSAPDSDRQMN